MTYWLLVVFMAGPGTFVGHDGVQPAVYMLTDDRAACERERAEIYKQRRWVEEPWVPEVYDCRCIPMRGPK